MQSINLRLPNGGYRRMALKKNSGFTLIELSIVLVIIGLIVGGVLVGQDLIKAAETRATIAQIEKYNTAVNTFRNKYNGIPGDLLNANATFGMQGGSGAAADRDGNGFIEGCTALYVNPGCENFYFWSDLSTAGFLDQTLNNGASGTTKLTTPAAISGSTLANYYPAAKLGKGNYIITFYNNGYNWFGLGAFSVASSVLTAGKGLTPNQAFNMDKKVDDGLPLSGIVQTLSQTALSSSATTWGTDSSSSCVNGTAYNLGTSTGDIQNCSIGLRFN